MRITGCICAALPLLAGSASAQEEIPLKLIGGVHACEVRGQAGGAYEVRTTGDDPYALTASVAEPFDHARLRVVAFEYRCATDLPFLEVFFAPPWHNHVTPNLPAAREWTPFAADLGQFPPDVWNDTITDFRLDFGPGAGVTFELRNLRIRSQTEEEVVAERERLEEAARARQELCDRIERALIRPDAIDTSENEVCARLGLTDAAGTTRIAVVGRNLDLPWLVASSAAEVPPPVSLPPALVAGEGASPRNHTLVRVLGRYGVAEVQFLAYPPEVMGGVQVEVLRDATGEPSIVTLPLGAEDVREVRLYSRYGLPLRAIALPDSIAPAARITVGRFVAEAGGEQIAVAPARLLGGELPVVVLDAEGEELARAAVPASMLGEGEVYLGRAPGAGRDQLLLHVADAPDLVALDPSTGRAAVAAGELPTGSTAPALDADGMPVLATRGESASEVLRLAEGGAERLDVGVREGRFWFTTDGAYSGIPPSHWVHRARFAHIRTDFAVRPSQDPDFTRESDPDYWADEAYRTQVAGQLASYDTDLPTCWEPCFTHRWFAAPGRKWLAAEDPETGLPRYVLLDRENRPGWYGEFGQTDAFITGSYAPGLTAVESMYRYPQREFLRQLAGRFRANPEHFVAVEPNHEMEINAESEATHGDYNPQMVRGFCGWLLELHGDLEGVNRAYGTEWTAERFDAPRNLDRGAWDRYSADNAYYRAWMRWLDYVIYRVIAGTYREALLAGFPPEAIRCHQIPDLYAVGSLEAFSRPAQRVTPIDWTLNSGVGYGFTRYGVWWNLAHNVVQGAWSSGFDQIVVGEYQSLTADPDEAYRQLAYMRDHGVQFIHAMNWPEGHDRGYNQALRGAIEQLTRDNSPKPGVTGGTGQFRALAAGEAAWGIVSLGAGAEHTGLLKSVRRDGSWEGSVYAVPFHAHVAIETVRREAALRLGGEPTVLGRFAATDSGEVLDVSLRARARAGTALELQVRHGASALTGADTHLHPDDAWRSFRFQVRVQMVTDGLSITASALAPEGSDAAAEVEIADLIVTRQSERTTKLERGILAGERHEGGVTFAVIGEE